MSTATATATIQLDGVTKGAIVTGPKFCLYEVRPIAVTLSTGDGVPAGDYDLTCYFGQTCVASAALTASEDGLTLSGTMNLSTTEMDQVFTRLPGNRIVFDYHLWDIHGSVLWGTGRLDIWRSHYNPALPTPAPTLVGGMVLSGTESLPTGADHIEVAFIREFTSTPSVVVAISKPDNSPNIGATVTAITSEGFRAELTAGTPADGYALTWIARG